MNSLQSIVESDIRTFTVDASFLSFGAKNQRQGCGSEETLYSAITGLNSGWL